MLSHRDLNEQDPQEPAHNLVAGLHLDRTPYDTPVFSGGSWRQERKLNSVVIFVTEGESQAGMERWQARIDGYDQN